MPSIQPLTDFAQVIIAGAWMLLSMAFFGVAVLAVLLIGHILVAGVRWVAAGGISTFLQSKFLTFDTRSDVIARTDEELWHAEQRRRNSGQE